tara:strand:- start:21 stop:878 length:858 start_codon:yes stop_codon:yes gene_type:complete
MPIRIKAPTADRHPRRPWNSPERRRERQREYMKKHGPQQPRRKTLAVTDKNKDVRKILKDPAGFKELRIGKATGGQVDRRPKGGWPKGGPSRPQSPKKWWKELPKWDRPARKIPQDIRDRLKKVTKKGRPSPGRPGGKGKEAPDKRWNKGDKFMIPLRAKKAVGGIAKKVGKRFLDFIKTGKHVDKNGVKVNVPKAAERLTGRPHVDHGKRKRIKHLGKGKAEGGRAGFQHGGRTNLLEELGRVEAEPSNRNRRAEISRVHGELNRGYKSGGAVLKGKKVGIQIK